jgi:hypothetical protein
MDDILKYIERVRFSHLLCLLFYFRRCIAAGNHLDASVLVALFRLAAAVSGNRPDASQL